MAYTTPLRVFQAMERISEAEETFTGVSGGDSIELANDYIIKDGYPGLGKSLILKVGGSVQDPADYTVDFERNLINYTGSNTGDAEVVYRYGPFNSAFVESKISDVEESIDEYTNTTYDGVKTVSDEVYDGRGDMDSVYPLFRRPVRSINSVSVNQPTDSSNPNYISLSEGLDQDYTSHQDIGLRFTDSGVNPSNAPRALKVSYDYGYSNVPGDVSRLAQLMVARELFKGVVHGAGVDGRDNFDPQTVNSFNPEIRELKNRLKIDRMSNFVYLAEEGSIS